MELVDAQTGENFTMNDYAGKVVLLETMAMWCPNCIVQANEVRNLHETLGNPEDLISVSLDVDINEDTRSLGEYASEYGFDWHFAVAPLLYARALGTLYTPQYLNPPLAPMMITTGIAEAGSSIPIAILAAGTRNQLARALSISLNPARAVAQLLVGREARIDVGVLNGHRRVGIGAGLGLDAAMIAGARGSHKRHLGPASYVVSGTAAALRPQRFALRAEVDMDARSNGSARWQWCSTSGASSTACSKSRQTPRSLTDCWTLWSWTLATSRTR